MIDNEVLRPTIGANIRRLRGEKGLSQDELASRLGISRVHLSRIENGGFTPGADLLYGLADIFGVSADTFRQVCEPA